MWQRAGTAPAGMALVLLVQATVATGCASAPRRPRTPRGNPTLVLASPSGERTIPVADLTFVYFKRIFYQRHAPRSEAASGSRVDIEDRRKECRCLRLEDWSKIKFSEIRQIELTYPADDAVARLHVTGRDGRVQVLRADSLFGARDSLAPRFFATVEGERQEYPLLRPPDTEAWPEERLLRLLLMRPPPVRARRR